MAEAVNITMEHVDGQGRIVETICRRFDAGDEAMLLEMLADAAEAGALAEVKRLRKIVANHTRPHLRLTD